MKRSSCLGCTFCQAPISGWAATASIDCRNGSWMGSRVREARGLGKVTNVILETGLTRLMSNHGLFGRGLWLRSCLACFLVLLPAPRDSDRGPLVALLLRGAPRKKWDLQDKTVTLHRSPLCRDEDEKEETGNSSYTRGHKRRRGEVHGCTDESYGKRRHLPPGARAPRAPRAPRVPPES